LTTLNVGSVVVVAVGDLGPRQRGSALGGDDLRLFAHAAIPLLHLVVGAHDLVGDGVPARGGGAHAQSTGLLAAVVALPVGPDREERPHGLAVGAPLLADGHVDVGLVDAYAQLARGLAHLGGGVTAHGPRPEGEILLARCGLSHAFGSHGARGLAAAGLTEELVLGPVLLGAVQRRPDLVHAGGASIELRLLLRIETLGVGVQ
jgi:hypothetical protein